MFSCGIPKARKTCKIFDAKKGFILFERKTVNPNDAKKIVFGSKNEKWNERRGIFFLLSKQKKCHFSFRFKAKITLKWSKRKAWCKKKRKISLFISLECTKKKRNRSHFVSFHFEGKNFFKRNRRTLGWGGRQGTATCHGKEGIKPVPQVHPIFTVLFGQPAYFCLPTDKLPIKTGFSPCWFRGYPTRPPPPNPARIR